METNIIHAIIPPFAIALIGYIYSLKDNTLHMRSVTNLIYYIFSPCLVFSSLAKRSFHSQEFIMISFSAVVIIFSLMILTFFYMKMAKVKENGFYLPIIFMGTGNIALPMALFLYGNDGLSKAIIFHIVNVLFLYSMGVFMVSKKTDLKELFKIPFLYAAAGGIFFAAVDIPTPESIRHLAKVVFEGIDILGKGAIPLLIISLGYSLKKIKVSDLKHSVVGSSIRIILGPAIAFAIVGFFRYIGWSPVEKGYDLIQFADMRVTESVIILMGAMPAPIASYLLNEKFQDCPEKAASMVLLSTLAALVTIPFFLTIAHSYIANF